ncbi:MAG: mannose-1-phosphate guanylyltransferase [Rhodospirillaceae bacterium TMED8]|nr:mannose-1-phosphate guanylyltransferase [Magnetovibrio sp.]OUT51155.1 MAG: mannose-1-phosphate guanylyltransferase [Rhodospirillaceae bacterium TMED8]|tara:strand:- start:3795 stop:4529 length:735 start_codon:yes stop_codon:yes gene_type:complete
MSSSLKRAIVLAAGKGLRMRPITLKTPKPMVRVDGRMLIDHALDRLEEAGVTEAIVNTHYLGDKLQQHLGKRKSPKIIFSPEVELLETGGGVKHALPLLGKKPFWVVNSDAFWLNGPTDALARMASVWDEGNMDALLLLHSTVEAYGYVGRGDFSCNTIGKLERRAEMEVAPWLFTGIQLLKPETLENTPNGPFSLNVIYDRLLEQERLFGIVHDGEWFHIGTPDGLSEAEAYMKMRYPGVRHR